MNVPHDPVEWSQDPGEGVEKVGGKEREQRKQGPSQEHLEESSELGGGDAEGEVRQCLAPSSESMCVSDWPEIRMFSFW